MSESIMILCHKWVLEVQKVKAKAWDEGAEASWERSTPEVNGQTHHWRHEGEPLNPYRQILGKDINNKRRKQLSESIMRRLDEMEELTYPQTIPPGVSVARYSDRLLAETRRELRTCITALKAVVEEHYPNGVEHDCTCCQPACACGHWEYPCPTVEAVKEALGVEDE